MDKIAYQAYGMAVILFILTRFYPGVNTIEYPERGAAAWLRVFRFLHGFFAINIQYMYMVKFAYQIGEKATFLICGGFDKIQVETYAVFWHF